MYFSDLTVNKHLKIKENKNHIYIAPHPLLSKCIAHYTVSFPNKIKKYSKDYDDLILIPDSSGCIIYTYENNEFSSSLWGATTKTVTVKNDVNSKKKRFFIEFMPGGLCAITGIKQSELCDIQISVGEIDKHLSYALVYAMESSNNIDDMVSRVNLIFLKEMEKSNREHAVINSALDKIKSLKFGLTIKQLALDEYVSERHLNRLFNEYIGMNTKMFLRLARINYSINLFKNIDYKNCTNIAQILGFFDQAHFTHDFKQVCGVSPSLFFKKMSDFYNEPFKY